MNDYHKSDPVPGTFDHRSGDCQTHGVNVVFFRLRRTLGPFFCVRCAREVLEQELTSGED